MTNATLKYLETLKLDALKQLAAQNNLTVHHKTGEVKLRQMIADKMFADSQPKPQRQEQAPHEPRIVAVTFNTRADVEAVAQTIQVQKPQFEVAFSEDDKVWQFKYRGAEDCGNMSLPLRQIKMCANAVARGAYALPNKNSHFDSLGAKGKNAYTDTVL